MALPESGKLVRDRIPEIVAASGGTPTVVVLSEEDLSEALHLKLAEEAQELRDAAEEARLEELADVYEVVCALAAAYGQRLEDVVATAERKRQERGGFKDRLWMDR